MVEAIKQKKSLQILSVIILMVIGIVEGYIYCLSVYMGPLSSEKGWDPQQIVLAYSVAMCMVSPAFIIGGILSQKFGIRRILIISSVIYGLSIALSGIVQSVLLFVILQGAVTALAQYCVFVSVISVVNVQFPKHKGLVTGLLYGSATAGVAVISPIAVMLCDSFGAGTALVIQGIASLVIMVIGSLLLRVPEVGDAIAAEAAAKAGTDTVQGEELPASEETAVFGMNWKRLIRHPSFYILFISVILIQMIGNVLAADAAYISENELGITAMKSAMIVSLFNIGACAGGVVLGILSDKIGPYRTTAIAAVFNGAMLLALTAFGMNNFWFFAVSVMIQGLTYNGITTLSPVIITESYGQSYLGVNMGILGISTMVVGIIGPQLGLMFSAGYVFTICAVLSIIGAGTALLAAKSVNKYYKRTVVK